ncbi:hypothetical protein OYE22_21420 [Streptomyces sp. 71268]|uniref:hypothetical protein n=1 Tax=Streptomyces sp. 71268 TaxID=3002640 RepID=UPI0023F65730|nr:hypothetical protein [Streptomyces sp. 71268]WEV27464.1 hypothetical protein OYE22_21420 [Streptomyces sp. 71268]
MTERQVRVSLLVWRPRDPDHPGDLSAGWPRVLQVRTGAGPWQVPSVLLRAGEPLMAAAERTAYALGLTLPNAHRVLAVDQRAPTGREPEELIVIVDGGWVAGDDVPAPDGARCACSPACPHQRRWAGTDALADDVGLASALGAAVAAIPAFIVNTWPAGDTAPHPAPRHGWHARHPTPRDRRNSPPGA